LFFDSFYSRSNESKAPPFQKSPSQHIEILKAIEDNDAIKAKELIKEHIQYSLEVLVGI
jgi:DNA-binding GntR family transcriptional regulator